MKGKIIAITSIIAVLLLTGFIYFKFYFVFGEGVKAGELNFVVRKGMYSRPMKAGRSRRASEKEKAPTPA
jgi:hypothetical protein